jgi:polyketide cyclase/dehydrase/lipid transport protein
MGMHGKKQLERDTLVGAPAGAVYGLFMDNAELAHWAPAVDAVTGEHGGDETGLGATRTCAVTMNGAKGTMVERCIEAVPSTQASFLVVDDSFGFTTMFTDYGFTAHFTPEAGARTMVRIETFYTPANPFAAVLNTLVIRRRLRNVVDELLAGLRTLAERRQAQPEDLTPPY